MTARSTSSIRIGITHRGRYGRGGGRTRSDGPLAWLPRVRPHRARLYLRRSLSAEDALAWVDGTPAGFTIDIQAFRALTRHLKPLRSSGQLGTIVLRFPAAFAPDLAGHAFLTILSDRLPGDRLAVELPDAWFATDQAAATSALLAKVGIGAVTGLAAASAGTSPDLPAGTVAAVRVPASPAHGHAGLKRWVERIAAGQSRDGVDTTSGPLRVLLSGDRPAASATARRLRAALAVVSSPATAVGSALPEPGG